MGESYGPKLSGGSIAFWSNADPLGTNGDGNYEIFLWNGSTLAQITQTSSGGSTLPDLDGGAIALNSSADLLGTNSDGNAEIFLLEGSTLRQITDTSSGSSAQSSLDAGAIAFISDGDPLGANADGNVEIFLCEPPAPVVAVPSVTPLGLGVLGLLLSLVAFGALLRRAR